MASFSSAQRIRHSFISYDDDSSLTDSPSNQDFSVGPENRAKTAHLADLAMSDNESSNHDELEFDQSDSPPQDYPSPFDTLHDSGITYRPQSTPDIVVNDSTPLLYHSNDSFISANKQSTGFIFKATMHKFFLDFTSLLPATFLGLMLNVIDGVSYGLIAFPPGKTFSGFGGDGVSMYMITCIVGQLVFSSGGSIFTGGNGTMIIETVPFFHILVDIIERNTKDTHEIIATTMISFALSSIFVGLTFFLLGKMRLGSFIGFFPRHILVGSIGGVGVFLIETGLEITAGLNNEGFSYSWATFNHLFTNLRVFTQWFPGLILAIVLRTLTHFFTHPLVTPMFLVCIPIVFYIIVLSAQLPLDKLRDLNWIFDVGEGADVPFYRFYTYFDFRAIHWKAVVETLPTQLALVFFSILHVPLNVPALSVSLDVDNVDLDKELVGHGYSNTLAGLFGTFPNYLCYSNSILFYRTGGGSRLSGYMLTFATFCIMLVGPGAISYIPVMAVGTLIFVLGIDLTKEAVWDTYGKVNKLEYFTIWVIVISMSLLDFVTGVIIGIILACLFFVVQNARRRPVRAIFNGQSLKSTVRRHAIQRSFLHRVGKQTQIIRLQGFLFFGTINVVEEMTRNMLDAAQWDRNPLRFLILDLSLVSGVDFSAAESFVRIAKLLIARDVTLVLCGIESPDSNVGIALRSVGCWSDRDEFRLEVAKDLNDALEYVENAYLRGLYSHPASHKKYQALTTTGGVDFPQKHKLAFRLSGSMSTSPRNNLLQDAATSTEAIHQGHLHTRNEALSATYPNTTFRNVFEDEDCEGDETPRVASYADNLNNASVEQNHANQHPQPLSLIIGTFKTYTDAHIDFYRQLAPYFSPLRLAPGDLLWRQHEESNGFYLIESGILKASYMFDGHNSPVDETMLTGTVAGEISGVSGSKRNCTVVAETETMLWHLSHVSLQRLEQNRPEIQREMVRILLKIGYDEIVSLTSYLAAGLA
ncbi:hypothetical protein E3Q06_01840 [Wallemia mellicola]|uniref:Sulfate transporter family protein n=1 Tax=Wallemia mellicola TaxID=1708541 RepID=A0AB38MJF7_9BASI|nr:hypothetical protein E3Q21_01931 [Wallemia mellicola]TIB88884.1 hypothetical protein E3Q20_01924 [Wallemia mellicola]TIC37924.1 hypothetical protein E3Q09_00469 [Wallemia mellicola]TIC40939.1 hypothetical protein E3Q07_01919 [Wallemia mellicola]TIC49465.1 hypothetical protein E3Q06_01840 [Wallemia mellicola]